MTLTRTAPPTGTRRLLEMLPAPGGRVTFAAHRDRHGELPLRGYAGPRGPQLLVDTVARADLRGRGGAGFPLATKLRAVIDRPRGTAVLVANGAESEPASRKDALLLCRVPHLVVDGALVAADAVGADTVHLVVHAGAARDAVATALAERHGDPLPVRLHEAPAGYVASQETALVQWLNGGPALPTFTPPLPAASGVRGRPTLVSNVETLAHLALVARYGADWYREVGTGSTRGTMLVTLDGAVARPGVLEVPFGARIGDVIGPAEPTADPQAVLVGGWFGAWVPMPRAAALPLDPEELRAAGTGLGAGVLYVLGADECGVRRTAELAGWLAAENAGQCGPCVNGLPAIASALTAVAKGRADRNVLARLQGWCELVTGRGACRHPDGVARLVASGLRVFADDVQRHLHGSPCVAARRVP